LPSFAVAGASSSRQPDELRLPEDGMPSFVQRLNSLDRAIAGGAAVAFIAAFLPWWGYRVFLARYDVHVNGWSAGFSAWAGTLLLMLAGVFVVAIRTAETPPKLPVGPHVLVAGTAGLGLLLVVIRWLTLPRHHGIVGVGARYGIWVAMIAGVVEVAAAVAELRASGETLPWQQQQQTGQA
jgi:hypothetical protein